MFRSFFYSLLLGMSFFCSQVSAEIHTSYTIQDVLEFADEDTLVVSDLNNVLIQANEDLGSDFLLSHEVKRRMKEKGESKQEVLHKIIPAWHHTLVRGSVKAVEPVTAEVIETLQKRGLKILGLTAQYTEMAYPTLAKLQSVGLNLRKSTLSSLNHEVLGGRAAKFIEGVVFVGLDNDKGETLMRFLEQQEYAPKKILFIDDKEKNVRSVEAACEKRGIPFTGLRYAYLDESDKQFDPEEGSLAFQSALEEWGVN